VIELLCDLNIEGKAEPQGALLTLSNESEKLLVRKGFAKYVNENININRNSSSGQLPDSSGSVCGVEDRRDTGGRNNNSTKVRRSRKAG